MGRRFATVDVMHTYVRVLRMARPYLPKILLSMALMVVFSLLSVFGLVLLVPFLEALFSGEASLAGVAAAGADAGTVSGLRERLLGGLSEALLNGSRTEALWRIVSVFFAATLVKNTAGYLQSILTDQVQHGFIRDLRNRLFARFTEMPLAYYHRRRTGELISRATNDVLVVNRCLNVSFTNTARDPVLVIAYLATAAVLSWRLTLLALLVVPVSLGVIVLAGRALRRSSRRQQESMADLTSRLQETIGGIRVVKAFGGEQREQAAFRTEARRIYDQLMSISRVQRLTSPLTEQLWVAVGLFILWVGGRQVLAGDALPPAHFIVFLGCIFSLGKPLKDLSQVNNAVQEGVAAAERVFAVLDHPGEAAGGEGTVLLDDVHGRLDFEDVRFRYDEGDEVLRGLDLQIAAGEMVALVGPSGAGKSTLVDLVPRFHDPVSGRVLLDGRDLRDLDPESLRATLGVVTQEVILFHDTIRANIAYGKPEARDEEIVAAAKAANAHGFIMELPDGYETRIGDRGATLSGGERQRLSIARAVLRNPAVLILDEATSSLDSENERLVRQAVERLVHGRTTLVVAHRLDTVREADRICVVERGVVTQQGTHEELLAAGGPYRRVHDLQFPGNDTPE